MRRRYHWLTVQMCDLYAVQDLLAILPMLDKTVVIEAEGATVLAALENGVSQYPKLEGRFLQARCSYKCLCICAR